MIKVSTQNNLKDFHKKEQGHFLILCPVVFPYTTQIYLYLLFAYFFTYKSYHN